VSRRCPVCQTLYDDSVAFCGNDGALVLEVKTGLDADGRIGHSLAGYTIVAHVADGATGRVYEARDPATRARVAIKVLHEQFARDKVSVERFKREYETTRSLSSPHIVQALDFGETADGSYFFAMEFLEGEELGAVLAREGAQLPERVLRIVSQVALALDHAHSAGIIHRDLKPDNLFIVRSGADDEHMKVLDFGSVKLQVEFGPKLTAIGTTLGSPYYMAPEQALGKSDVDRRADVFALASIAYEALTGHIAFEGRSVGEILMRIVQGEPRLATERAPHLPAGLDGVFMQAFKKDKTGRHGSASELAGALLQAFGLKPDVQGWARATQAQMQDALDAARRAPRQPIRSERALAPRPSSMPASDASRWLPGTGGYPWSWWALVVGIGVAVAALLAMVLYR
jgi:serine/threonine protein kinase